MLTSLSEHMDTLKKQHFKRKALAPSAAAGVPFLKKIQNKPNKCIF